MIGVTKSIGHGDRISFTRANPVTTYNAVVRYAKGSQCNITDINTARTGSRYVSFTTPNGLDVSIRCSNHTKGYSCDREELGDGVEFDGATLSIDLSIAELSAKDVLRLVKECEIMLMKGIDQPDESVSPFLRAYKGVEASGGDVDYVGRYDDSVRESVLLFPFEKIDVQDRNGEVMYHFGEDVQVEILHSPYIEDMRRMGEDQRKIDKAVKSEQERYRNNYSWLIDGGVKIKRDREDVLRRRKEYLMQRLNESIDRLLECI